MAATIGKGKSQHRGMNEMSVATIAHKMHDGICHVTDSAIHALTGEVIGEEYDAFPDDLSDVLGGHLQ